MNLIMSNCSETVTPKGQVGMYRVYGQIHGQMLGGETICLPPLVGGDIITHVVSHKNNQRPINLTEL